MLVGRSSSHSLYLYIKLLKHGAQTEICIFKQLFAPEQEYEIVTRLTIKERDITTYKHIKATMDHWSLNLVSLVLRTSHKYLSRKCLCAFLCVFGALLC